MIKVKVNKAEKDNRILAVVIKGHANYDNSGKDIVCSAVSALAIGAVNSVETLLNIDLILEEDIKYGGFLTWKVPVMDDPALDQKLQLLMQALVESLLMVEQEYNKYLQVSIETS